MSQASQAVLLPKLGLTMEEATLVKWHKNVGDFVEKDELLLEVETDKATLEVESPYSGVLLRQAYQPGDVIPVGAEICHIGDAGAGVEAGAAAGSAGRVGVAAGAAGASVVSPAPEARSPETADQRLRLSPAARKLARELGLSGEELRAIRGSGPRGRIVLKDLAAFADGGKTARTESGPDRDGQRGSRPAAPPVIGGGQEIVPLNRIRSAIARRLTASFRDVPQFTVRKRVDLSKAERIRSTLKSVGIHLSINDFLIQAAARALEKHELVNAYFYEHEGEYKIIKNKSVNIGLAVAMDQGLVVPVIKRANELSLVEIAKARAELTEKAQAGALSVLDMSGGTFTISNLGKFGTEEFTAIVNPPEAAILAVGAAVRQPVVTDAGGIEVRPVLTLTGSFDHRVVDGADAARFMADLGAMLESDNWRIV